MKDKRQDDKSMEKLLKILREEQLKDEMPEHLRGKNLMHLLPDDGEQKEENIISKIAKWLTSKSAIPVYTLVVAALFAVMVIPKINKSNDLDVTMEPQAAMEMAEHEEDDSAIEEEFLEEGSADADSTADGTSQNSTSPAKGAGTDDSSDDAQDKGEDLSGYFDGNDPNPDKTDPDKGQSSKDETNYGQNLQDSPDAFTGGYDRDRPSSDTDTGRSAPATGGGSDGSSQGTDESGQESSGTPEAQAFSAALQVEDDRGYYIGDWKEYHLYWRTARPDENFNVMLQAVNEADEVVVSHPIKGIHKINLSFVAADDLFIIGSGADRTVVYRYNEVKGTTFAEHMSCEIIGGFYDYKVKDNNVYLLTVMQSIPPSYSGDTFTLKDSAETGAVGVLMMDTATNESRKCVISGTNAVDIEFSAQEITIKYKGTKEEKCKKVYQLSGLSIIEKK